MTPTPPLDSKEEVARRFNEIPKDIVTIPITTKTLKELWILIEFVEQIVETDTYKIGDAEMREVAEEILFRLPVIDV